MMAIEDRDIKVTVAGMVFLTVLGWVLVSLTSMLVLLHPATWAILATITVMTCVVLIASTWPGPLGTVVVHTEGAGKLAAWWYCLDSRTRAQVLDGNPSGLWDVVREILKEADA